MNLLIVAATKIEITSNELKQYPILITGVGMVNTAIALTQELMKKSMIWSLIWESQVLFQIN